VGRYDSVICIGALEHFVSPETRPEDRIAIYRDFFHACASWLKPGGYLSLQTSAYGRGSFVKGAIASIFPESDLPRLGQLLEAAEGSLELVELRNDREDYARTCQTWVDRLRSRRLEASHEVGEETVARYEQFLDAAVRGFRAGIFLLLRMRFRSYIA
jgi:cyclopropane-fatty-acyl-phospholipid synthase